MERMTVVDLFAGAGGLSLGLQRVGFAILKSYDNWKPAVETYRNNVGDHIEQASITAELDAPDADVYVGGPPCQGFSSAGMRRADDSRNTLVGEFSRLVARKQPVAFVFENVEGFLTGADGSFVFELLEPLIDAGYRIHLRKINAANYGVPQHRKRVVAIGGLGWEPSFPRATRAAFGAPGADLANGIDTIPAPTFEEALRDLPPATTADRPGIYDHTYTPLNDDDLKRAKVLKQGQRMRDLPEELWHKSYRKRAFRRVMDGTPTERRAVEHHREFDAFAPTSRRRRLPAARCVISFIRTRIGLLRFANAQRCRRFRSISDSSERRTRRFSSSGMPFHRCSHS